MIEHSMFSAGSANASIAIAESFKGHDMTLVSLTDKLWWDDCPSAKGLPVVRLADASGLDILIEIDRTTIPTQKRKIAKHSIWVVRHPFILGELESSLFPTTQTPKREFEGLSQVWLFDTAVEEGAVEALELLTRVPVKVVPALWTPTIAEAHMKDSGIEPWISATVTELRRLQGSTDAIPMWKPHIGETNTTNASSAVLPMVILREAVRRGFKTGPWKIHNTEMLVKSKFFMENVAAHCMDIGISGEFIGRQRSIEWAMEPMSFVLAHSRFTTLRPFLLDVIWAGIPLVHNSPVLRDMGLGLERLYYSDNHVGEACDALTRMESDMVHLQGIFAPGATEAIRSALVTRFSKSWCGLIESFSEKTMGSNEQPSAASITLPPLGDVLKVGFSDMWENFNPEYNFFTLMLSAAGAAASPPVRVVGGPADASSTVVIFGPFGENWKGLPETIPKIHFTGENTVPVLGPGVKLNLGFHHFDMVDDAYLRFPLWILEIDWFGADAARIANPKPIPLDLCTKVDAASLARKKNFCAFVVSNPTNQVRNTAFQWLSDYKQVDSAGRCMNNMGAGIFAGAGGGGGEHKKVEFLKDYKFCLAYENNSARGYVTEKFLHAKAAGCIPIYWGDPAIERDFPLAGAIDARGVRSKEELINLVRAVDESDSEWLKRFAVPALDPYRVTWCQRTMAECARRIFGLGGFGGSSWPLVIGAALKVEPEAPVAQTPVAAEPEPSQLEVPLMVTCANRKFLPSLQHWLTALGTQIRAIPGLKALVYLFPDVPEDTVDALKEKFTFAIFKWLPTDKAPFPDFWEPQHYGWKLWILDEVSKSQELAGMMAMYMDAGSFLCRWPKEFMLAAQAHGVCLLEDPREENRRWCSPEFCRAMEVSEGELAAQQIQAATICFRIGSKAAILLFSTSMTTGSLREVLVGPKWAGKGPDGKPFGHRHDQSILSILSAQQGVKRLPVDSVQHSHSLRKTFTSGRAIYMHRGNFNVNVTFMEGIDDAYVINLDRRADRMKRLWDNHPGLEGRVERWPAVDGRSLRLTPAIARLLKPNDFFWKKAVTGCALSHLGLWDKLANETPDIKNYLILEDDVKFNPYWDKAWQNAVNDIPEDYDIIYLGGVLPPNWGAYELAKERFNDSFSRIKENTSWGQSTPNRYFHFCAYAYVLSKTGAQKVMGLLDKADGYWTSADHILCNPVDTLKAYIFDPLLAGCYQDNDPKYAMSQFNDFSRVDGFDSDLWNNDERWSMDEVNAVMGEELNIRQALEDARAKSAPSAPSAPSSEKPPVIIVPKAPCKPEVPLPRRFVCLDNHNLKFSELYEGDWLLELLGNPTDTTIHCVKSSDPPPSDCPVVILQKPYIEILTSMLERWDSFGAKFHILHLSDETVDDALDAYDLDSCVSVLRFYWRDTHSKKVTFLPLGYHWPRREPHQDILIKTPKVPFRQLTWSFFGTNWAGRKALLKPLIDMDVPQKTDFLDKWKGEGAYTRDQYIEGLLDTVFVPCPEGVNGETFRFYEALEFGCIPLVVRTPINSAWIDWISEQIPILPLGSWDDAAGLVQHLLKEKVMLEAYRNKIIGAWMAWKKELVAEVKDRVGHTQSA